MGYKLLLSISPWLTHSLSRWTSFQQSRSPRYLPLFQSLSEDLQLHCLSMSTDETNAAIVARTRELLIGTRSNIHRFTKKIIDAVLMREPAVGKGLLLRVSTPRD